MQDVNYRTTVVNSLSQITCDQWEQLRVCDADARHNPMLAYAYLSALELSGCATQATGWTPQFVTVWHGEQLHGAVPLYLKSHSYGEYVFDWSWAQAFEQHGLHYYPKLLSAVPFTPVSGSRLLARDAGAMHALVAALQTEIGTSGVSSGHVLFLPAAQAQVLAQHGFMLRTGVQFHWENRGYRHFTEFLDGLDRKKRKNIQAERRKVDQAGIRFRRKTGRQISREDWSFFIACYQNTYFQHGGRPYLNLDFFLRLHDSMPDNMLMILGYRGDQPLSVALLFMNDTTVYGRYWGCVEYIPCLHFETAYYQPLEYCIEQGLQCFEGGAQGEHKMARGFLPQTTYSAHCINHPDFADAIRRFLQREQEGIAHYVSELNEHSPYGHPPPDSE